MILCSIASVYFSSINFSVIWYCFGIKKVKEVQNAVCLAHLVRSSKCRWTEPWMTVCWLKIWAPIAFTFAQYWDACQEDSHRVECNYDEHSETQHNTHTRPRKHQQVNISSLACLMSCTLFHLLTALMIAFINYLGVCMYARKLINFLLKKLIDRIAIDEEDAKHNLWLAWPQSWFCLFVCLFFMINLLTNVAGAI